ncbi:MAG: hypothetical protein A2V74_03210 [Acidobacteria bacterium RBG_16_70_10]|nr:MAG: hypothetical protein A2V74_03210 [Acidobacteria bacterium RBG_16_70_10]
MGMRAALSALAAAALLAGVGPWVRAETLPPPPAAYFNDYAGLVGTDEARRLDAKLGELAAQTSTQVVVAVFPELPSPSLEDFTVKTAQSWRVGRKELDNGAVFFVFVKDRKMRIEVGYGLEGALPDALAFRILEEQVKPRFRTGDYAGGLEAGIDGILAATRGEYKAIPAAKDAQNVTVAAFLIVLIVLLVLATFIAQARHGGIAVGPRGRTYSRGGSWGGGSWSGGGGGGGGGWSSGGGGFSGGGGSFGGGGASSSW